VDQAISDETRRREEDAARMRENAKRVAREDAARRVAAAEQAAMHEAAEERIPVDPAMLEAINKMVEIFGLARERRRVEEARR
jgi:hypothetical protein